MLRVAIGPRVPLPSWNWVGCGLIEELAKCYHVVPFESVIPSCDVLIAVKFLPKQIHTNAKIIYLPIDLYLDPPSIERDAPLLRRCAAIGCHAEPLIPYFKPYCNRVFFIDHHAKYALDTIPPYKERGFILWVGAFEHVPYLLKWCQKRPLPAPLVLLSNLHDQRSRKVGSAIAQRLAVPMYLSKAQLNGHRLYPWSEQTQQQLMSQAKVALDIKGGPWLGAGFWHQQVKPPTKGQQFVCSGIPLAVNRDSHIFEYFQSRGLTLATPDDPMRWFSREYWEETKRFAENFRPQLSLETIGLKFKSLIESLGEPPSTTPA